MSDIQELLLLLLVLLGVTWPGWDFEGLFHRVEKWLRTGTKLLRSRHVD